LAASFGVVSAAHAQAPATAAAAAAAPSDKAQIEALERGFSAGFNAKSTAKVMSYYARDGLFVFDVTPPRQHVGWASYKKDWDEIFAAFPGPLSFKISDLSVTVAGDVAYGHSIQTSNFTAKDGAKVELVARVTDVYRKIDGHWKIVQEHVSVPVDLDTMKPDPLSKP
jgi:ketosteroid isomerase-like protein